MAENKWIEPEDNFCTIAGICRKYDPKQIEDMSEEEFGRVWNYIQQSNSLYYLGLLRKVVPLGMLNYRLQERIKFLLQQNSD